MIVYVQSYIRGPGYSDFVYYKWLFQGPTPQALLGALLNPDALVVIGAVVLGMGGLQLLAPRWLALAIPPYVAEVLSGHTTERILQYHYVLLPLFPLVIAAAVGARGLLARRTSLSPAIGIAIVCVALVIGFEMGRIPPALEAENSFYARPDAVAQLEEAERVIPAEACVSADPGLAVWLANRPQINETPVRATSAPTIRCQRIRSLGRRQCAKIIPKIGMVAWSTAARPDDTYFSPQKSRG